MTVQRDDWRLANTVETLEGAALDPTDGEEIFRYASHLKRCELCLEPVRNTPCQWWFVTADLSCCICETCYNDLKEHFKWKKTDGWDINWPD